MEKLVTMFAETFRNKTVWLSGHTGFKGAWLAHWLLELGADVHGFALEPDTEPALFDQLGLARRLHHQIADVRDARAVAKSIHAAQPDFVFHLAAQPLVRLSYEQPVETYATNVMGTDPRAGSVARPEKTVRRRSRSRPTNATRTANGFTAIAKRIRSAATTLTVPAKPPRKSPLPRGGVRFSKIIRSRSPARALAMSSAAAIGRRIALFPTAFAPCKKSKPIAVRNPNSTRPWQHVLEPLSGYLWLAASLSQSSTHNPQLASAFNFGPAHEANRTVGELVEEVLKHWPGRWENKSDANAVHEAGLLQLATDKASALLGWSPVWGFPAAVEFTIQWYRRAEKQSAPAISKLTSAQIRDYCASARRLKIPWAV